MGLVTTGAFDGYTDGYGPGNWVRSFGLMCRLVDQLLGTIAIDRYGSFNVSRRTADSRPPSFTVLFRPDLLSVVHSI